MCSSERNRQHRLHDVVTVLLEEAAQGFESLGGNLGISSTVPHEQVLAALIEVETAVRHESRLRLHYIHCPICFSMVSSINSTGITYAKPEFS